MYVTVILDAAGRLTAHQPRPEPNTSPAGTAVTVLLCPIVAVDRTTGTLAHPYQYTSAGPIIAACRPSAPIAGSVGDLNAPTVAVCVHPLSHRMFAVGPFIGPDRAEQWWHARTNRFADTGGYCHIVPLTAPPADAGVGRTA
jgi:hypothetical protein